MHVVAGGSGYAVNNIVSFNPVHGTHSIVAKLRVTGVDGSGAVTSFVGYDPGAYSAYPPVGATTTTGGSGTGLVISPLDWGVRKDAAGTGVTVTTPGSGYTSFPDATFSAPVNGASAARGTVVMGKAWSADSASSVFNVPTTASADITWTNGGPVSNHAIIGDGTNAGFVQFNGPSGTGGFLQFRTGDFSAGSAAVRWMLQNKITEATSNAGSNLVLSSFSNTGTFIRDTFTITRSNSSFQLSSSFSVWNATPPASKPAVTGSRGGNAAVASLITALASYGLITDSTTA
jgi:hypothetical protein